MTDYPNREHSNADKAARRRALAALEEIKAEADNFIRRIDKGYELSGADAERLVTKAFKVAVNFSIAETLSNVREWHAADQATGTTGLEHIERNASGLR